MVSPLHVRDKDLGEKEKKPEHGLDGIKLR
jgi:hypothetical protein